MFVACLASLQELREQLSFAHQQELLSVQEANRLVVSVLREEMEQQRLRELEQNFQKHSAQMGTSCCKLLLHAKEWLDFIMSFCPGP